MIRAVLDSNVILSAMLFRGVSSGLRAAWQGGRLQLVASPSILAEYAAALAYPKFGLGDAEVLALLRDDILPFCEMAQDVAVPVGGVCRDPDDDKFLFVAAAAGAHAVVSGDADLLALGPVWRGVEILSVRAALALVGSMTI